MAIGKAFAAREKITIKCAATLTAAVTSSRREASRPGLK